MGKTPDAYRLRPAPDPDARNATVPTLEMSADDIFSAAFLKLEIATKIWKEERTRDYERAEQLYQEALILRQQLKTL